VDVSTRGLTISTELELVIEECCNCGITFAMPKDFKNQCLKDPSKWFYCPNGHTQHYTGPTEAQKQKKRADALAEQLRAALATGTHYRDQAQAASRSAAAFKGVVTKTKKRVGNGVCPCCNRTFQNVARHMTGQHPEYADSIVTP
jgi:hypothetical protein